MGCYNGVSSLILRNASFSYLIVNNDYEERVYFPGSDVYFTVCYLSVTGVFSSLYAEDKSDLSGKRKEKIETKQALPS